MPLIDHFSEKMRRISHFHSFHNAWATEIAYDLNRLLPEGFLAEPNVQLGRLGEIDVRADELLAENGEPYLITYQPPHATERIPVVFPNEPEIFVVNVDQARTTVGVIEIVSPANKDRPQSREIFVSKCLSILSQGIALVIVDIVTSRSFNFHNAIVRKLQSKKKCGSPETPLYCSAYRYVSDQKASAIELWWYGLAVGDVLPEVPLYISSEIAVPVRLEQTYVSACNGLRIPV
ncbi:DUF4058 family protein [Candidatus Poribacteria bacterium]|nr:DUF4058 family protein [Candidatus Poribacteria bacterium]